MVHDQGVGVRGGLAFQRRLLGPSLGAGLSCQWVLRETRGTFSTSAFTWPHVVEQIGKVRGSVKA